MPDRFLIPLGSLVTGHTASHVESINPFYMFCYVPLLGRAATFGQLRNSGFWLELAVGTMICDAGELSSD